MHIFTDESGDLGWSFEPPYGKRGSSRYLTIVAICVPDGKCHHLDRIVRDMYRASRWDTKHERKWTDASEASRLHFARQAARLLIRHPDITYHAIVAYKPNVPRYVRRAPDALYNFMLKVLLLNEMSSHRTVHFVPDQRSVRLGSGNSLHDYLQISLWFEAGANTDLTTAATDSRRCLGLQFADFMAGAVNAGFEHNRKQYLDVPDLDVRTEVLFSVSGNASHPIAPGSSPRLVANHHG